MKPALLFIAPAPLRRPVCSSTPGGMRAAVSGSMARLLLLVLIPLTGSMVVADESAPSSTGHRSTFVQLFEWKWTDIAQECENFLGPKGFSAVQVSPPNEHIDHRHPDIGRPYAWWARYQPVSYKLVSRSGSPEEFADMVQRCNAAGVGIYADAVINHMAHQADRGIGGSKFSNPKKRYPDFRKRNFNRTCVIAAEDYQVAEDVKLNANRADNIRRCQLGGLPDLDMGDKKVQRSVAAYLQSMIDIGVAGFRVDAAKHMYPEHIQAILDRINGDYYVFQEVIDAGGAPVTAAEYTAIADVTELKYSLHVGHVFADGSLQTLQDLTATKGMMASDKAVVFIDNHDNQRGHGMAAEMTHRSGPVYELANMFMLAWPYGYPKLMSSYEWGGVDDSQGPPHDGKGNTLNVYNDDGSMNCFGDAWKCEHRLPAIANMVEFRNVMQAANAFEISNWWQQGDDRIAFTRGNADGGAGFVVINRADEAFTQTFQTGMAQGLYCNIASAEFERNDGGCTGELVTVNENGEAEITVPAMAGFAMHIGALVTSAH